MLSQTGFSYYQFCANVMTPFVLCVFGFAALFYHSFFNGVIYCALFVVSESLEICCVSMKTRVESEIFTLDSP